MLKSRIYRRFGIEPISNRRITLKHIQNASNNEELQKKKEHSDSKKWKRNKRKRKHMRRKI